ncbi:MAG: hypothetical protein AB7O56_00845 [Bauldia sp.]
MDWIGTAFGLLGVLSGYFFYRRTRTRRTIEFAVEKRSKYWSFFRDDLLDSRRPRPQSRQAIIYNGAEIPELSRAYVLLRNNGTATVRFKESIHYIHLRIDSHQILDYGIVVSDDDNNDASISLSNDGILTIYFDYLRAKDSVLFYVEHTGQPDSVQFLAEDREKDLFRTMRFSGPRLLARSIRCVPWIIPIAGLVAPDLLNGPGPGFYLTNIWAGVVTAGVLLVGTIVAYFAIDASRLSERVLRARFGGAVATFLEHLDPILLWPEKDRPQIRSTMPPVTIPRQTT